MPESATTDGGPQGPHRLARAARSDRQLLARSSITLVSRGLSKFAQIFFLVIAARLLTVEEFASYSYLIVLAAAFTIMSDTGVPLVAGRDASAGRGSVGELFWSSLPIVLVTSLVAAVLLPIFGAVDSGPGSTWAPVLLTALFVIFNRFLDLICQLLRGDGRFELEAALQMAGAVLFIGGGIAVTVAGYGVTAVMGVFCVKELLIAAIGFWAIRKDVLHPDGGRPRSDWRRLLSIGIRLAIAGIALALAMRIPLAVLGNVGSATEVALFSAAQRFGDGAYVLAITGGFALLPGIAYLAQSEPDRARRLLRRVLIAVVGASALLAVVAVPLAEPIMRLVFGGDFAGGDDLFRIIVAGLPAYTGLGICWYAVVAFDGEARLLGVGLASLLSCAVLSAVLIPAAADEGAAWAYVGSLYATALLSYVALDRQLRSRPAHPAAPAPAGQPTALAAE
ncbi:MAG: oligosaccharide flippase family protein [Thermoleophilaceae bacterium]|nr:oligosaccharide flippase family protein [Thermoleophilaceae bacterium]